MAALTPLTFKHKVMTCPVCQLDITAEVTFEVTTSPLGMDVAKATVEVKVDTKPTRFNISHICTGLTSATDEVSP